MEPVDRILLVGNIESLSLNLLLNIDYSKYRVTVFSENKEAWLKLVRQFGLKEVSVVDTVKTSEFYKYVVYLDANLYYQSESDLIHREVLYRTASKISKNNSDLSVFIFPNIKNEKNNFYDIQNDINKISDSPKVFFLVTDMVGAIMPLNDSSMVSSLVKNIVSFKSISISKEDSFVYPFDSEKLAKLIIQLFKKNIKGVSTISVRGEKVKLLEFAHLLGTATKKELPLYFDLDIEAYKKYDLKKEVIFRSPLHYLVKLIFPDPVLKKKGTLKEKKIFKIRKIKINLTPIKKIVKSLIKEVILTYFHIAKILVKKIKLILKNRGFWKANLIIGSVVLVLLSPFILIAFSVLTMLYGVRAIDNGHFYRAKQVFVVSEKTSSLSSAYFGMIGKTKIGYRYVEKAISVSVVINRFSTIGQKMAGTSGIAFEFSKKILGDEPYRVSDFSEKIFLDLDSLMKELTHVAGELEVLKLSNSLFVTEVINKLDLKQKIEEIGYLTEVVKNMPVILGENNEKTYLFLFQNNMELRPTGGFIGSIGLIKFNKGRLIDINVMDVYSVDGQLKGHVEPPSPIRRHLNEANWYLRDSNWDPDFAISADRASWFLEKEIDVVPDAVVGVDLEAIKAIVSAFGELDMPDFNRKLNSANFYDIVQYESERDFFPGSRAKSNFLMSLSKTSLLRIKESSPDEQVRITKNIVREIQSKHVQVYFKEKKLQAIFDELGWTGQNKIKPCLIENCLTDYLSINESNMGVNKANYFIERSGEVEVFFENGSVVKKIKLLLNNVANEALSDKARYKAYIRVFAPQPSIFGPVSTVTYNGEEVLGTDYQEITGMSELGFLVVVEAGRKVEINLSLTTNMNFNLNDPTQKYQLLLTKQAGIENYPFKLVYNLPSSTTPVFEKTPFSLTDNGSYVYNTVWSKDISVLTSWK